MSRDFVSVFDLIGAFGAALIVGAYLLLQLEKLEARSLSYSLMNAVGSALILVSLAIDFNMPAFIVEAFWLLVSGIGLVRCFSQRRNPV